jgi:sulfur carrier protein
MRVLVNGEAHVLPDGSNVADAVAALGVGAERGVAVAIGGEVVPRAAWEERSLSEGEELEVVHAVQGG